MSWNDAVAFTDWLSRKEQKKYRLPSEAEWEYACRAGTATRYVTGDDPESLAVVGNLADGTAKDRVTRIGRGRSRRKMATFTRHPWVEYAANPFGLYDMTGNVWEWCSDWYSADYYKQNPVDDPRRADGTSLHVNRGGGWRRARALLGSSARSVPGPRSSDLGFRIALESSEQESVLVATVGDAQPSIVALTTTERVPDHSNLGFVSLFNGKDLTGWVTYPEKPGHWRVENGIITGSGGDWSSLWTVRNDCRNFHLRVEARINKVGVGGVLFRGGFPFGGYHVSLVGNQGKYQGSTGGLVDRAGKAIVPHRERVVAPGQWFVLEVIADGDSIVTKVNGETATIYTDAKPPPAANSIGLDQWLPATVIEFRKIEIKELSSTAGATGGSPTGPARTEAGGTPKIDPSRYIDTQLITSCSGPLGEIFGGGWWSVTGPKSTIKPHVPPGDFSMSSGGYLGTAAHVTGARALGGVENAKLGVNLRRGGAPPFDASRYHGISFYAKADKPMEVQVGLGQENSVFYRYNNPKLAVTVGTTWSRYVVPFDAILSDPLPGGGRVPVTLATVDFLEFLMPVGAFDFWVDEIYFVRGVENVTGSDPATSGGNEGKPLGAACREWCRSAARTLLDKAQVPHDGSSLKRAGSTGPPQPITNSIGMKLVLIPAGTFLMGSPEEDKAGKEDERPSHPVRIMHAFYLGTTEVTRGQFRRFVESAGYRTEAEEDGKGGEGWNEERNRFEMSPRYFWQNPGFDQTDEHPVVNVTWNDAAAFADWLSRKENRKYRLPTEAEWEYACRAGQQPAIRTATTRPV